MRPLRLATRHSPLALWQARFVARQLRQVFPRVPIHLVPITSTGDQDCETPLYAMGNTGVFVKEVQLALLDGRADIGVHSCKDLPTSTPEGLAVAAHCRRHDPRDALIGANSIAALPDKALVGTSSLRRRSQLAALRPDLRFTNIRGNVATRIGKVHSGEVDATLLAHAGLQRLGMVRAADAHAIAPTAMVPAAAQGIIALECRAADTRSHRIAAALDDPNTARCTVIERALLAALEGGCSLPLGIYVRRRADARYYADVALANDSGDLLRQSFEDASAARLQERLIAAVAK